MTKFKNIILFSLMMALLQSCASTGLKSDKNKKKDKIDYENPGELIDTTQVRIEGQKTLDKKIEDGPKPYGGDFSPTEAERRITIAKENIKSYVSISDDYSNLKQNVSLNLQGLDFAYVMSVMADIGGVNILVGDEVSGTVNAKFKNVPWDVAFQTLLDMKTLAADIDAPQGIIRVHTPDKLKQQENLKSERNVSLQKRLAADESVKPVLTQLFKLYYISPDEAKTTIENLYGLGGQTGEGGVATNISNLSITVENTTRSIIVRGSEDNLDVIADVVKKIDVRTQQVLIEAFVVEAGSDFQRQLGTRIGAMTKKGTAGEAGSEIISGGIGGFSTTPGGVSLGAAAGTVTDNSITGAATSGIGIIKTFSTAALKLELEALESTGLSRMVSSPSVFTLNNQQATITQGTEIPYQVIADGEATIEFKEASLSLTVTPSVIGDGNVLLDINVTKDSPDTTLGTEEPAIEKNEITTKLLISDGDIVVIGGIKIKSSESTGNQTPGVSKVPVLGNLFKSRAKEVILDEMLVFIAPRVIG